MSIRPEPFKPLRRPLARRAGVTLLELLIVVVIVAIVAGIALPNYAKTVERTKVQEAEGVLNTIYQAQRVYRLDFDSFGTLDQLAGNGYLTDPNPNSNWSFSTPAVAASSFQAQASRTGKSQFLQIDEAGEICQSGYPESISNRPAC